jgi:hypothetical protein
MSVGGESAKEKANAFDLRKSRNSPPGSLRYFRNSKKLSRGLYNFVLRAYVEDVSARLPSVVVPPVRCHVTIP